MYPVVFCLEMVLRKVFGLFPKDIKKRISIQSLFSTTFRIPEKDRYSRFNTIKYLFKTILNTRVADIPENITNELIFDSTADSKELRKNYIRYFTKTDRVSFVDYNDLVFYPSVLKKIFCFLGFLVASPLIVLSVAVMDKNALAGCSLLVEEGIVLNNLLKIVREKKVNNFYQFSIYETYSNLFAVALMKNNIDVVKIPSEVPLALWNKKIVASELVVCNAYQYEEIEKYRQTMVFDKTNFWGPELILEIKDQYKNQDSDILPKPEFQIGFYSTRGWLRKVLGHIDQGNLMEERENKLKLVLKDYVKKNNLKLGIFLHPREKKKENIEKTKKHYAEFFEDSEYAFLPFDIPTNRLFDRVDLAVAFTSTIMFERLYCGFKCLFVPFGMNDFPIEGSAIANICAASESELESKLNAFTSMNRNEFFSKNKIEKYPGLAHLA